MIFLLQPNDIGPSHFCSEGDFAPAGRVSGLRNQQRQSSPDPRAMTETKKAGQWPAFR